MIGGERLPWNELRFFFLCKPATGADEPRLPDLPDQDQTGVVWVPLRQLPFIEVLPQVSNALLTAMGSDSSAPFIIANPHA